MYPPTLAEMSSVKLIHTSAPKPTAEGETPAPAQGESDDKPAPAPRDNRIRPRAAVTNAPAIIAGQETPEALASPTVSTSPSTSARGLPGRDSLGTVPSFAEFGVAQFRHTPAERYQVKPVSSMPMRPYRMKKNRGLLLEKSAQEQSRNRIRACGGRRWERTIVSARQGRPAVGVRS